MSSRSMQQVQNNEIAGFIAKTYEILNNQEFSKITYWSASGTQFIIKDVNKFQQIVLPRYFRHNKINSFIRQLNMYGFHKSRSDHTKSVFSHPYFVKDRQDLLIDIKRKIKGKDIKLTSIEQTPQKKYNQNIPPTTQKTIQTGRQLFSNNYLTNEEQNNGTSFNFICTRLKLSSFLNLNHSLNRIPQSSLGELRFQESQGQQNDNECVSIQNKIQEKREQNFKEGLSYKFLNPSCFFSSMKQK